MYLYEKLIFLLFFLFFFNMKKKRKVKIVSYLRIIKTALIRRTPLGTYLCMPHGFKLETFLPIIEIDKNVEMVLDLCDGTRTREDILAQLSAESGEPVPEIEEGFDGLVEYLMQEGILQWTDTPSYILPIHNRQRPFSITLDLTSACNLSCPYCSAEAGKAHPEELTLDDLVPFVEQAKQLKPSPIAMNGGEPLLKKDMVLYMLEQLSPIKEIALTIFTNGTLITKDYAQQLYDAGLRICRVSVDGHTEALHDSIRGKGNFEKTIQGIRYLRELGIHVDAIAVISTINYEYLHEIRNFFHHLADSSSVVPVAPYGRAFGSELLLPPDEEFDVKMSSSQTKKIQLNVSPRNRCNVGETIYIAANGDIFPCFYMQFPEFKAGNIRENSLSEVFEGTLLQSLMGLTVDDIDECKDCEIRYYCGGGCRGMAYRGYHSVYCPDPHNCEANKLLAHKILEDGEENTKKLMEELLESTRALQMVRS